MKNQSPFNYSRTCTGPLVDLDIVPANLPICDEVLYQTPDNVVVLPVPTPPVPSTTLCPCIKFEPGGSKLTRTPRTEPSIKVSFEVDPDCCTPVITPTIDVNVPCPCVEFTANISDYGVAIKRPSDPNNTIPATGHVRFKVDPDCCTPTIEPQIGFNVPCTCLPPIEVSNITYKKQLPPGKHNLDIKWTGDCCNPSVVPEVLLPCLDTNNSKKLGNHSGDGAGAAGGDVLDNSAKTEIDIVNGYTAAVASGTGTKHSKVTSAGVRIVSGPNCEPHVKVKIHQSFSQRLKFVMEGNAGGAKRVLSSRNGRLGWDPDDVCCIPKVKFEIQDTFLVLQLDYKECCPGVADDKAIITKKVPITSCASGGSTA